jgi:hypothetical protein
VENEILGSGRGQRTRQQFVLKNKPLTYLPGDQNADGPCSTLAVFVNGTRYQEVPSFFGRGPQERVYIVRHDAEQNTTVTFGDGVRGARLPTGVDNVIATYRHGAGEAAPPAGGMTQLVGGPRELVGIHSPIRMLAGKDPTGPKDLVASAKTRALMLGRAVSALDFAAVAVTQPGAVRASAEFAWLSQRGTAGVLIRYIGDTDASLIEQALRTVAEPTVALQAERATAIAARWIATVEIDPRRLPDPIAAEVVRCLRDEVHGVLALANVPIGQALAASRIYDAMMSVEGVVGVSAACLERSHADGSVITTSVDVAGTFCDGAGTYYDFTDALAVQIATTAPRGPLPELDTPLTEDA